MAYMATPTPVIMRKMEKMRPPVDKGVDLLVSNGGQGQDHHVGCIEEGPAFDDHVPDYPDGRQD